MRVEDEHVFVGISLVIDGVGLRGIASRHELAHSLAQYCEQRSELKLMYNLGSRFILRQDWRKRCAARLEALDLAVVLSR